MKNRLFLSLILSVFMLGSCIRDAQPELPPESDGVPVDLRLGRIGTRSEEGDAADRTITQFRLIVFRPGGGGVAYNKFVPDLGAADANPVRIEMMTGTYDFAFIANEGAGTGATDIHTVLGGYFGNKTLNNLHAEAFASTAFMTSKDIPMTKLIRNVVVKPEGIVNLGSADIASGAWSVELTRLGVRLDIELTASHGLGAHFTGVEFQNVPNKVFLFPEDNGGSTIYYGGSGNYEATTTHRVERTAMTATDAATPAGGTTWKYERIILPASIFAQQSPLGDAGNRAANSAKAITLLATMNDRDPLAGTIGVDETAGDFTAPRNKWFKLNGVLKDYFDFSVGASDWDMGNNNFYFPLPPPLDASQQANCLMIKPGAEPFSIPVSWADDAQILAAMQTGARIGANDKLVAELLWTDTKGATSGRGLAWDAPLMDVDMHDRGSGAYIVVSPGITGTEGNAVIALRRYSEDPADHAGEILWSWHLWITGYDPGSAVVGGADGEYPVTGGSVFRYDGIKARVIMDRNLGAMTATEGMLSTFGTVYQWGMKNVWMVGQDITTYGTRTVYDEDGNIVPEDTLELHNATLFGNSRTGWSDSGRGVFDPCPAGWRVPAAATIAYSQENSGSTSDWVIIGGVGVGSRITSPNIGFWPAIGYSQSTINVVSANWTSSTENRPIYSLFFRTAAIHESNAIPKITDRIAGGNTAKMAVRCVKE